MCPGDVEHWGDELHALIGLSKEISLGALNGELSSGHDLRAKLVLQAVDEDIVRQRGRTRAAWRTNERQANRD